MILGDLTPTTKRVLIAEGFATCGTLRQETGQPVIGAMNAGNLLPVCEVLSAMYPSIKIVVCGDDDRFTDGNPGRTKAEAAALATGARVAFPILCDACNSCTDWNDAVACPICHEVGQ
jgi:putative DNA primase/helicase